MKSSRSVLTFLSADEKAILRAYSTCPIENHVLPVESLLARGYLEETKGPRRKFVVTPEGLASLQDAIPSVE
jgi:hypothetical protein